MKKILILLSSILLSVNLFAQLKEPISKMKTPFGEMPFDFYMNTWTSTPLSTHIIPCTIYRDFMNRIAWEEQPYDCRDESIDAKFRLAGNDKILCCIDCFAMGDRSTSYLAISDDYGNVTDRLLVSSSYARIRSSDFRIISEDMILVYSIIPQSCNTIYMDDFSEDKNAAFTARIKTCRYSIENEHFVLKDTRFSKVQMILNADFPIDYEKRVKIWEHFDLSE